MYELTGTIKDVYVNPQTGKAVLNLSINERQEALQCCDKLSKAEKLSIKIDKYRGKRSLDANAYFWSLCGKLAEHLSDEKVKHTKEDIYINAIKEIGVYKDFENLTPTDAKTIRTAWEMLGTGWITEQVDFMPDGENVIIRCYYGSSQYNTKQMSRLIDNIVQDCQAVGIETKTPDELANLKSLWKAGE
jgi:hypothetical protein